MKKAVSLLAALALLGCASNEEETTTIMKEEIKYVDVVKEGEIDTASIDAFNAFAKANPIYFDNNSAKIKNPSLIKKYAEKLKSVDDNALVVANAYCDKNGSAEYNKDLGVRRAIAVKEALEAQGIGNKIDTAVSHGKEKFDKALGLAGNRRVDLFASVNK